MIVASLIAAGSLAAAEPVSFARAVKPLHAKRCFACHGPDKQEGGVRFDSAAGLAKAGKSKQVPVVAGAPERSELLRRVSSHDEGERMPPEGKPLSAAELAAVKQWIAEGAKWENHWAFEPLSKPAPPPVRNAGWVRNPIDAFVLEALERRNLQPAAPADPRTLLRRAHFDVTGLPPTPAETDAFLAAAAKDFDGAYAALVDRLLADPRFGERWARHWLDVVRYAETNSFERDGVKANAWRYRDWVINAINNDKPYGRFVMEQIAGDELPDGGAEGLIGTGFLRLGLWDDEPADRELAKYDGYDDLVTATSQAFLGLTVNCARCHDHKIDPIPQSDYYSMVAYFRNLSDGARNGFNWQRLLPLADPAASARLQAKLAAHRQAVERVQARQAALENILEKEVQKALDADAKAGKTPPGKQPKTAKAALRKLLREKGAEALGSERFKEFQALNAELEQLKRSEPKGEFALAAEERRGAPPETFVLARGNPEAKGKKVEPAFLSCLGGGAPKIVPAADGSSSGRRRALAEWIAAPENKLAPRVAVNRLWQHHFGRGIVRSANNFGQLGDAPTHPALLDWLAGELLRNGGRMKPLHRLMMLSATYRQASRNDESMRLDPTNDGFARFNLRRLSAEELRDTMLAVAGDLNPKAGGPSVYPEISREVLAGQSVPGQGWHVSTREEQRRRTVYVFVKRSLPLPLSQVFDFPDTDGSCEGRFLTTQPGQALALLNGAFANQQANALAKRLQRDAGADLDRQLTLGWRLAVQRDPVAEELVRSKAFVAKMKSQHQLSAEAALAQECLLLLNLNEFVYLD